MLLKDKIALITGAGRGIGREIALLFAKEGASLVICSRHRETIEPVAEELEKIKVLPFVINISDEKEVETMINATVEKFGRIDILVNNAGITLDQFFLRSKTDDWNSIMEVNLNGTYLCSRIAARKMVKQKSGRIINISSIAGETGNIGQAAYSASKAGILGFTKSIAKELGRYNICANAIVPGLIETDMIKNIEKNAFEEIKQRIPLGRLGIPQDVANAALFLSSEFAGFITGQIIRVSGGL